METANRSIVEKYAELFITKFSTKFGKKHLATPTITCKRRFAQKTSTAVYYNAEKNSATFYLDVDVETALPATLKIIFSNALAELVSLMYFGNRQSENKNFILQTIKR